jgi:TRAP-type C4-dicarboxylate transport system permease small subunit
MQKLNQIWTFVEKCVAVLIFWFLVLLNFANVITRRFFPDIALAFTEDLSMLLFLWMIFFAAAMCYIDDSHLGLPLFYDKLSLKLKLVATTVTLIFSALTFIMLFYATFQHARNQFNFKVQTAMGFPALIGGVALPVGCLLVSIRMFQFYINEINRLFRAIQRK